MKLHPTSLSLISPPSAEQLLLTPSLSLSLSLFPLSGRYLGETPEWEFIRLDEEHLLPFQINRPNFCKQRVSGRGEPQEQ